MEMAWDGLEVRHRRVPTNGIWMHVAEQGREGPLVLLLHGFPELWFSWRHQMAHLARNGFRAVAPDMRGYGDTDAPPDPQHYTMFHLVGDLVGLLDHLQEQQAFVIGQDWGANVAWHLCLFRPDRVRALVCLGVPYMPPSPSHKPTDVFKSFGKGSHIIQFQEPGRAERSFARYDAATVIKKFLLTQKVDLIAPPNVEIIDFLESPPSSLPPWIDKDEVEYFATEFEKSGFVGPLNYYRMMDTNWTLLMPWKGAKISVATKFIVGDKDLGYETYGTKDYVMGGAFGVYVPKLEVKVIAGGHHFIQQERAEEVNSEITDFLVKQAEG